MAKRINVNTALSLLIVLLQEAGNLSAAIRAAKAEGRDDLTDDEVASFAGKSESELDTLQAKIDALPQ